MAYPFFARVSLAENFPQHGLSSGDLATIVEIHEGGPGQERGYSLEVFNAVGETIIVMVVEESKIDGLVKSPPGRHSREGGSPEDLRKTGFPPSRE